MARRTAPALLSMAAAKAVAAAMMIMMMIALLVVAAAPPSTAMSAGSAFGGESLKAQWKTQFVTKTGTTIAGVCTSKTVVLGADSRATSQSLVVSRDKLKVRRISDRIFCCIAGAVGDCEHVLDEAVRALELHRIRSGLRDSCRGGPAHWRSCSEEAEGSSLEDAKDEEGKDEDTSEDLAVVLESITSAFKATDGPSLEAAFIIGSLADGRPKLFQIDPAGVLYRVPYCAMGSGSTYAFAILDDTLGARGPQSIHRLDSFESEFSCQNLTDDQAVALVQRAIHSGISNDMGSGSDINLVVLSASGTQQLHVALDAANCPAAAAKSKSNSNSNATATAVRALPRQTLGHRLWMRSSQPSAGAAITVEPI